MFSAYILILATICQNLAKDVKKWWYDLRGTIYTLWPQNVPKALSLFPIPIVSRVQLVRNSWGSNDVARHSLPPAMFCPLNPLTAEECALHRLWRHETQSEFVQRRQRGSLRKPHHAHTEPRQGAKVEDCVKMLVYPGRSKIVPQFNTQFGLSHYWYGHESCPQSLETLQSIFLLHVAFVPRK